MLLTLLAYSMFIYDSVSDELHAFPYRVTRNESIFFTYMIFHFRFFPRLLATTPGEIKQANTIGEKNE